MNDSTEPYIGEIRQFSFGFAPEGWALCNGEYLPINKDTEALYSVIGLMYGGDGRTSFAVPDLRSRTAINYGSSFKQGSKGGVETVSLSGSSIPSHTHSVYAYPKEANQTQMEGNVLAKAGIDLYAGGEPEGFMESGTLGKTGGGKVHENMPPFLTISYCIALTGTFPPHQ